MASRQPMPGKGFIMSNTSSREDLVARRYREAGDWLLRLNGSAPPESEVAAWLRWCEEDPANLQAFESVQADWRDILALRQDAAFVLNHDRETGLGRRVPMTKYAAAAAAVAAIVLAVVFRGPIMSWEDSWKGEAIVADTANRTTPLADGSLLTLRAKAVVRVDFTSTQRRLELQDDGEAYFKVKHDPLRPFVVNVGDLAVQAIGTAFDVRHDEASNRVWVTVEEGRVKVMGPRKSQWTAGAGDRLEYSPAQGKAVIARIDTRTAAGWREGEFAYEKVPMRQVIEDIARYSSRPIVIEDEHAREIPYTGTVFVRSLDDWLTALSMKYPLEVVTEPDGSIVLKSD